MLCQGFPQLYPAMFFATFDQQIDYLTTGFDYPVDAAGMINKAQYFNAPRKTLLFRPVIDAGDRVFFALRNASRGDLNPVHP